MTRTELINAINAIVDEHYIEDDTLSDDIADKLDEEFGLIDEDDEEEE